MLGALPAESRGLPEQWGRLQRTESPLLQARLTNSRLHAVWEATCDFVGESTDQGDAFRGSAR